MIDALAVEVDLRHTPHKRPICPDLVAQILPPARRPATVLLAPIVTARIHGKHRDFHHLEDEEAIDVDETSPSLSTIPFRLLPDKNQCIKRRREARLRRVQILLQGTWCRISLHREVPIGVSRPIDEHRAINQTINDASEKLRSMKNSIS